MADVRFEETDRGPALDNGFVRIEVHLNRGTYDVIDHTTGITVTGAGASVSLRDGPTFSTRGESLEFSGTTQVRDVHGEGLSMTLIRETFEDEPEVHVVLTLCTDRPFAIAQAEVQNLAPAPIRVQTLRPVDGGVLNLGANSPTLRFYKHGWQSWSPTVILDCAEEDLVMSPPVVGPGTQPPGKPGRFLSELMTAVVDPASNHGVIAGLISTADQFSHVWFDREPNALTAASYADGIEVPPRQTLASERLLLQPTADPVRSLSQYGNALAREMDALPYDRVASGWCSWYYYFTEVTEAEILDNLDRLHQDGASLPIDYVQIDDGYQTEIGDWLTTNENFPNGMKYLADPRRATGAGLWVAPFLAGARSQLFREHPDWFVKFSTGTHAIGTVNWGQPCFSLDTTHPEVAAWLSTVFRTICDDWGYDYVKIDFIFAAAIDGVRYDPNVTRAQAYRRGVEIIREAVGKRFILACGNPQGPSVGLVDGARIGPDVAPNWLPPNQQGPRSKLSDPSAINSIRNTITRFWMHGRLWMNDPDCLMVRDTDTSLTLDEVRALTTVIGLTGGMVLDSDKMSTLPRERLDLISLLLPVYGQSAIPLDLFQTPDIPRILDLDCGTHRILGIFNWSDETTVVDAALPPGDWHGFEFWSEEYLGLIGGRLSLEIAPHGCKLFRLTPDRGHPQVVGSTYHITQGAMEIASESWDGQLLHIESRPVARSVGEFFVVADGKIIRAASGPIAIS